MPKEERGNTISRRQTEETITLISSEKIRKIFISSRVIVSRKLAEPRFFLFHKFRKHVIPSHAMFSDQTEALLKDFASGKNVLEYGSGGSTSIIGSWAHQLVSVETEKRFAKSVRNYCANQTNIKVIYANIGITKSFGQPLKLLKFANKRRYLDYSSSKPWVISSIAKFDLVIIDGRFRVASAINALINNPAPFVLVIDDYSSRSDYWEIEQLTDKPFKISDGTAFFRIKTNTNLVKAHDLIEKFKYDYS